jgi:hypothetical protein
MGLWAIIFAPPEAFVQSTQQEAVIARGLGPRWFRAALVAVAVAYFVLLAKRLPDAKWTRPISHFVRATCLFPGAMRATNSYRLAAWSCGRVRWEPLDVRAYFPMRAEDKESRFYRLAHFYKRNRPVMQALDAHISARHPHTEDGVDGAIGGIRLYQTRTPIPPPGSKIERFVFDPLPAIPREGVQDLFYTPGPERKRRCEAQR